jgi:two-component system, sensor histidine kinase PdtaS
MVASERIHVLGRVHNRLTRSADNNDVDMRDFLTGLCEDLRTTMVGERTISLDVEIEAAHLRYGTAITVGLIVNELVQNALKYAFPGDRPGRITVRFGRKGGEFHLTVVDDGVGEAAPLPTSSGLGQRLVGSFVKQLRGSHELQIGAGRTVQVRFPAR